MDIFVKAFYFLEQYKSENIRTRWECSVTVAVNKFDIRAGETVLSFESFTSADLAELYLKDLAMDGAKFESINVLIRDPKGKLIEDVDFDTDL